MLKGDPVGAERAYLAPLDWARQRQAKSWELRTATSDARLLRDQGRACEAHELLAPVYGWFTEGFATKDLKDAKALLEELETEGAPAPAARPLACQPGRSSVSSDDLGRVGERKRTSLAQSLG